MSEDVFNVYRCHKRSCKMHTPEGKEIVFIDGACHTKDEVIISYLEAEIAANHPLIYKNDGEVAAVNPVDISSIKEAAAKEAVEAYKREMEASNKAETPLSNEAAKVLNRVQTAAKPITPKQ